MRKTLFIVIAWIMNTACIYAQILPDLTEVELLKGKVKTIQTTYYHSNGKRTKVLSAYDSLGRMTSKINYYIKENPQKEYFSYNSIGHVILLIYEENDSSQQHSYAYKYDDKGRIISQLELWDGKFFRSYDNIIYNDDNLPIQYFAKYPYSSEQFFIRYNNGNNHEKIRYIEKKQNSGIIDTVEEFRLYNDRRFLIKKKRTSVHHGTWNDIANYPSKHSEEYDYVDYKYDKHGNWIAYKCYLNWKNNGRRFHVKMKRKIEYW